MENEIKIGDLVIKNYSEKSIAVYGDTKPYKEILKKTGGKFNPYLRDGKGWILSNKKKDLIIKRLTKTVQENEKDTL